jgi:deoxyuridine 5'-triphosphate nucleotidohydrolase
MNIFTLINTDEEVFLPQQQTTRSAGYDLRARIGEERVIQPGERMLIPTGVCLTSDMPDNYLLAVCSRSGLAINHGIYVLNAPGIIDADFVGHEIQVILANCGSAPVYIQPRLRIAQCVLFEHKGQVGTNETLRLGGFGSTG